MAGSVWSEEESDAYWERRDAEIEAERVRLAGVVTDASGAVGAEHPDTLAARGELLEFCARQHLESVLDAATDLVRVCLRVLGDDHRVTIAAQAVRAVELIESDEGPDEGVRMLELLVERQTRVLGPADRETLRLRRLLLGSTWRYHKLADSPGDLEPRARQWAELVADHVRLLGADHPDTLTCRDEEAADCCEFGAHDQEARHYAALVADRGRLFGVTHPDTLRSRTNHVISLFETGAVDDRALSTRLRDELVADCLRVLGRDDPLTQMALESVP
ncbi:hypothetical protein [Nocardia brasiliensis]